MAAPPFERFGNRAQTRLVDPIDDTQEIVEVEAAGPPFPQKNQFRVLIQATEPGDKDEIALVTVGAGTTLWKLERGVDGTDPVTHDANALVTHVVTAESLRGLRSGLWVPQDNELQAATIAVDDATSGVQLSVEVNFYRVFLRRRIKGASKLWLGVSTAGNTLTHAWIAIYDEAGTTKLVEATGLTTTLQSTGVKTIPFDGAAILNYDADSLVIAANAAGTTRPSLGGVVVSSQVTPNIGPPTGTAQRAWRAAGALTTPPATVTGSVGINQIPFIGIE